MTTEAKTRSALKHEGIAIPTVIVTILAFALWTASLLGSLAAVLPLWAGLLLSTIAAWVLFTPLHDASHKSVDRGSRLNEFIGRLASIPLMAPFTAFRFLHLEHHKHVNEPEHDPDHYSGRGPRWQLPLRWLTQDIHYYQFYVKSHASRPRAEWLESWLTLGSFVALAIALSLLGYGYEVLLLWVLPARFALMLLAFAFDYLPHKPHDITAREDRYRATRLFTDVWLTPLFLYQNYHLIHHLYPGVPFYKYIRVWRERKETLLARGARPERLIDFNRVPSSEAYGQSPDPADETFRAIPES